VESLFIFQIFNVFRWENPLFENINRNKTRKYIGLLGIPKTILPKFTALFLMYSGIFLSKGLPKGKNAASKITNEPWH